MTSLSSKSQCGLEIYDVTPHCLETNLTVDINFNYTQFPYDTAFEASFNGGAFQPVTSNNCFDQCDWYPHRIVISGAIPEQQGASIELRVVDDPACSVSFSFDVGPCPSVYDAVINEFHYNNLGNDQNEFVEIIFLHRFLEDSFSQYSVNLVDAVSGEIYESESFDNLTSGSGIARWNPYGALWPSLIWNLPGDTMHNDTGGIAICGPQGLIQFISYGGSFSGSESCTDGVTSSNIDLIETDGTLSDFSLQRMSLYNSQGAQTDYWAAGINTLGKTNNFSLLPIELAFISASKNHEETILTWKTLSETNNKEFEVQRSFDGINFSTIGIVEGLGDSDTGSDYQFIDKNIVYATLYYRLRQNDFDGQFSFSDIVSVSFENSGNLSILSMNKNSFNLTSIEGENSYQVYNSQGRLILEDKFRSFGGNQSIYFPSELPNGVFIIKVVTSQTEATKKFIIL